MGDGDKGDRKRVQSNSSVDALTVHTSNTRTCVALSVVKLLLLVSRLLLLLLGKLLLRRRLLLAILRGLQLRHLRRGVIVEGDRDAAWVTHCVGSSW